MTFFGGAFFFNWLFSNDNKELSWNNHLKSSTEKSDLISFCHCVSTFTVIPGVHSWCPMLSTCWLAWSQGFIVAQMYCVWTDMFANDRILSVDVGNLLPLRKRVQRWLWYSYQQVSGAVTSRSVTHWAEKQSLLYFPSKTSTTVPHWTRFSLVTVHFLCPRAASRQRFSCPC